MSNKEIKDVRDQYKQAGPLLCVPFELQKMMTNDKLF